MKYLSRIEDYVFGNLKGDALEDFITELDNNAELKSEFEIYLDALNFTASQGKKLIYDINKLKDFEFDPNILLDIKKYGNLKPLSEDEEELLKVLQFEQTQYKKGNLGRPIKPKWIKVAAVFSFIIVLLIPAVIFCPKQYDDNSLYKEFYSPYYHTFNTRSASSNFNLLFQEGIIFYDSSNYEFAIERFEKIPDSLRISSEVYIVEGICYIEMGNNQKAIERFEKINEESLLYSNALWYKGLCYLKNGEKEKAKSTFKKLEEFDNYFQNKIRVLLRRLR